MAVTQEHIDKVLEETEEEGNAVLRVAPINIRIPGIPPEWATVLADPDARLETLKVLWAPIAHRVPKIMRSLKRSLQGVGLLTTKARPPSIVYFLTMEEDDEPYFYRGFAPAKKLSKHAKDLPEEFLDFYQVHDGWVNPFLFMGPLPNNDWSLLGTQAPSNKFLTVFMGNGGELLGYDLRESPALCYLLPSGDAPPEIVPKIWARIDRWVSTQMEDKLPYRAR